MMIKKLWRDISIILTKIWVNLLLFTVLMVLGAVLLRFFGDAPGASWPVLFLDIFHLATIERVDPAGRVMPVILAFIMPILTALILGEGILRVITIYLQRDANRKDWDLMVVKAYHDHTIMCGLGEMGRQIAYRMLAEQPGLRLVLIDPRPGILAELGLSPDQGVHFQGDMTNVETLIQANIKTAKQAILTAGIDSVNLETAYKIQQINPALDVWVRLHHSGLAELLDLSRQPQIHFFCPYQQAADSVVEHILVHKQAK
jgi:voltage-gated potassium channel Kch